MSQCGSRDQRVQNARIATSRPQLRDKASELIRNLIIDWEGPVVPGCNLQSGKPSRPGDRVISHQDPQPELRHGDHRDCSGRFVGKRCKAPPGLASNED